MSLRALRNGEGGSAVTETAILMLVSVPLLLYSFFTVDLISWKLDVQEAVTSSAWDYVGRNYEKEAHANIISQVPDMNKGYWCDNTIAWDGDPGGADCDHLWQEGFAAKMVYPDGNGSITCARGPGGKNAGTDGYPPPAKSFHDEYATGGTFQCEATGHVHNYLIPQKFLQGFAREKLTSLDQASKGTDVKSLGASGNHVAFHEQFAIFTDTYALENTREVHLHDTGPNQPFYDRVWQQFTYPIWYLPAAGAAALFAFAALDEKEAIIPAVPYQQNDSMEDTMMGPGPNPNSLHMAALHGPDQKSNDYYVTDYKDWDNDLPKSAFDKRGDHYMGCAQAETPNCQ